MPFETRNSWLFSAATVAVEVAKHDVRAAPA